MAWTATICPITGREVKTPERRSKADWYTISVCGKEIVYGLCSGCFKNPPDIPKHLVLGLMANGKWPDRHIFHVTDSENREENEMNIHSLLRGTPYPKTPKEKKDNLFLSLFKGQGHDGQVVSISLSDEKIWAKNYFKNIEECIFYFAGLKEEGLIFYSDIRERNAVSYRLTHKGLNEAVQLENEGDHSTNCFIAMAFTNEMLPYREAIKSALHKTGFNTVIIDEEHLASDKTIPDGILAAIRRSKFCIADFSFHKHGVYFESGFALGLGKPVIYTCTQSEFEKSHFDIKQLQHIIYENPDQLEKRLIDKIEAWIK